jgi:hypothetical protein
MSQKKDRYIRVDFLLSNADDTIVGKVSTSLTTLDIKDFLEELKEFSEFFPGTKGHIFTVQSLVSELKKSPINLPIAMVCSC